MTDERTAFLRSLFDTSGFGLEIGPSFRPLLPKAEGFNVETVDFADADSLREMYKDQDVGKIEEVDYVSDGRGLFDLIGEREKYDFIYASHVIEHVPDVVRFLQDCETLLKPDGKLVLAIPDKRYCFDAFRPVTTVGQALQAYLEKRTRHTPGIVFDNISTIAGKNGHIVWLENDLDNTFFLSTVAAAHDAYQKHLVSNEYVDCHGWQFVPSSFLHLIKTLRSLGYIKSGQTHFSTNPYGKINRHEFYAVLEKDAPTCTIPDIDLFKQREREIREVYVSEQDVAPGRHEFDEMKRRLQQAELEVQRLKSSKSWRLTSPLRLLRQLVG